MSGVAEGNAFLEGVGLTIREADTGEITEIPRSAEALQHWGNDGEFSFDTISCYLYGGVVFLMLLGVLCIGRSP